MTRYCKTHGAQYGVRRKGSRCFHCNRLMTMVDPTTVSMSPKKAALRGGPVSPQRS
jgi:hypothetical protein